MVLVTQDVGRQLLERPPGNRALHLQTRTSRSMATTYNLLAESTSGDPAHVTMVGAHLDSVRAGGGNNDNGSGVAAVLETARQMARVKPLNQLRFALWGAEEQGLLGSRHYVRNLDDAERAKLGLYLNFDMIGSPNPMFYVYGGDGSAGQEAISSPQASARIVDSFSDFYAARQLASKRMNSGGRSDHKPFADIGVPFGGIFTGAESIKTQQEADTWGGTAGEALDPCYHRGCDNLANVNEAALDVNADAVAHATLYYAMNRLER
ncbi:M28 family peptidase [Comamonas endophytica]|uniref:M28 family peptidase n=1 Tax=Comamonas endophytica TaxID=2949090 RepID=UPI00366D18BE